MCMLSKKEGRIEEMLDAVGLEAEKERGILWWLTGWEKRKLWELLTGQVMSEN